MASAPSLRLKISTLARAWSVLAMGVPTRDGGSDGVMARDDSPEAGADGMDGRREMSHGGTCGGPVVLSKSLGLRSFVAEFVSFTDLPEDCLALRGRRQFHNAHDRQFAAPNRPLINMLNVVKLPR